MPHPDFDDASDAAPSEDAAADHADLLTEEAKDRQGACRDCGHIIGVTAEGHILGYDGRCNTCINVESAHATAAARERRYAAAIQVRVGDKATLANGWTGTVCKVDYETGHITASIWHPSAKRYREYRIGAEQAVPK